MIVKTENKDGSFIRTDDCITACITVDEQTKEHHLICTYNSPHRFDNTYPLSDGDKIYFMNESGKTIDFIRIVNK